MFDQWNTAQLQARALSLSGRTLRKLTGDLANASTGLTATEHAILTSVLNAMTRPDAPDLPEAHTTGALEAITKAPQISPPKRATAIQRFIVGL